MYVYDTIICIKIHYHATNVVDYIHLVVYWYFTFTRDIYKWVVRYLVLNKLFLGKLTKILVSCILICIYKRREQWLLQHLWILFNFNHYHYEILLFFHTPIYVCTYIWNNNNTFLKKKTDYKLILWDAVFSQK